MLLMACEQKTAVTTDDQPEKEATVTVSTLSGEVFYLQRKLLPPGAELTVSLEDVSKMDVASPQIAAVSQTLEGAPPYAFSLNYDPSLIVPNMSYSLRATITLADKLLMTSTESLNPFRDPDAAISIKLSMVAQHSAESSASAEHKAVTGLAVVSVNPLASLSNTYWKLISIGEQTVAMTENQKQEAFFQLNDNDSSLKGFAGCNNMMGSYASEGNDLSFGPIAMTKKACLEGMDTEAAFAGVLEATAYFSIHEHKLTLLNSDKKPIASFEAQYFN